MTAIGGGWLYSGNACAVACGRSRRGWVVPGGDHAVRAAVRAEGRGEGSVASRILSGRQDGAVVGDCAVDCFGGDFDADDYRDSGAGVRGGLWIPADRNWLHDGAHRGGAAVSAKGLSGRDADGVSADRPAVWADAVQGDGGVVSADAGGGGGRAGVCRVDCGGDRDWDRGCAVDRDYFGADAAVYVRGRDGGGDLDGRGADGDLRGRDDGGDLVAGAACAGRMGGDSPGCGGGGQVPHAEFCDESDDDVYVLGRGP